jgi:hypothetical protein
MWDKLRSADLDRVGLAMEITRADTVSRHAEELKSLEAKQADELQRLDAQRAEIEMLDALIDNFAQTYEVRSEPAAGDETAAINFEAFRKFAS